MTFFIPPQVYAPLIADLRMFILVEKAFARRLKYTPFCIMSFIS
jgi:hypothetical protein